ncbi:spore germination protein [Paenibacillus filicis]|uniref:Spore germination protein n=1 Tax=Paenibacillus gyeongsangnamensis TaxID=3388067 RepID=A0ABT4Q5P3_9BACL|nr:spore germination protein [Paenibacillus filicis]MCZ8512199.1 spore germination protein [Paenibacillus filicis]
MSTIINAPITLTNVSGTVIFGNVGQIAPKSSSTTTSGAGGGQVGDAAQSNTFASFTITRNTQTANKKMKKMTKMKKPSPLAPRRTRCS